MATLSLKIGGATVDFGTYRLRVHECVISYEAPGRLFFSESGKAHFHGSWEPWSTAELLADGVTIFKGKITEREAVGTGGAERIAYSAMDARFLAEADVLIKDPVTGVEDVSFNVRRGDPDWQEGNEFRNVGQILKKLFDDHKTLLEAAGAGPVGGGSPYIQSDLDALTVVPPETITFTNQGFTAGVEQLMEWHPGFVFLVDPSSLVWRFYDRAALADLNLTLSDPTDLIISNLIRENVEESYTAVKIRGRPRQTNKVFKLSDATLEKRWDTSLDATWNIQKAFSVVAGDSETGTPTSQTATSLTDTTKSWAANKWLNGWVEIKDADGRTEHHPITSHTATVLNWAITKFIGTITSYRVWQPHAPEWYVWRRFRPTVAADRKIAKVMDPWDAIKEGYFGSQVTPFLIARFTVFGVAMETYAPIIVTVDGDVIANMPLAAYSTMASDPAKLYSSGQLVAPSDVILRAPVYTTPLEARAPSTGYSGSAFTRFGIERERIEYIERWRNADHQAVFDDLAAEKLKAYQDVRYHGEIQVAGFLPDVALLGKNVNIDAVGVWEGSILTGWEAAKILLKEVRYSFSDEGPPLQKTTLVLDNDMRVGRANDRLFAAMDLLFQTININVDTRRPGQINITIREAQFPRPIDAFGNELLP